MTRIVNADDRAKVDLLVNGEHVRVFVEPTRLLSDVLREELGLTGLKVACGLANCGACTVLIDDLPYYSCITLAHDCPDHKITTIEGLSAGSDPHPVQKSFVEHDAFQCGYCTPGQLLTLTSLFARNKTPSEAEIRHALSGNLCRCGAYLKILKAGLGLRDGANE
jgi:aerobic-type carbon monoxide dehydrogenase small subunit (CoxS/CutS family)